MIFINHSPPNSKKKCAFKPPSSWSESTESSTIEPEVFDGPAFQDPACFISNNAGSSKFREEDAHNPRSIEDFTESITDSTNDFSDSSFESILCLVLESPVEQLMRDIRIRIKECNKNKHKLKVESRRVLEKAKLRYRCGDQKNALVSMRRVHTLRNQVASLRSTRYSLWEVLVQIKMEIQNSGKSLDDESVLNDLEVEGFRSAVEAIQQSGNSSELPQPQDGDLLRELDDIVKGKRRN